MNRFLTIARKEIIHILNDKITIFIIFMMPIIQLILFGYALNSELKNVKVGIIDHANNKSSLQLKEKLQGSSYFQVIPLTEQPLDRLFLECVVNAVVVIPSNFTNDKIQIILDATDPNTANIASNYLKISLLGENALGKISVWYNPDQKSTYFFVPGLLALILVMICTLLTSIAITREKETGTLEQILVSPVKPWEIILGKLVPYIGLGFLDAGLIITVGLTVFQVPFLGSVFVFCVLTLLYIITALSLGLFISTLAKTQQTGMMFALIATLLPTMLLSGFIFPIPSMPKVLQFITYFIPAKYYLEIVRGIMLKGNTLSELCHPAIFLLVMSLIFFALALKKFKTTL